jgi:hypothetical protein
MQERLLPRGLFSTWIGGAVRSEKMRRRHAFFPTYPVKSPVCSTQPQVSPGADLSDCNETDSILALKYDQHLSREVRTEGSPVVLSSFQSIGDLYAFLNQDEAFAKSRFTRTWEWKKLYMKPGVKDLFHGKYEKDARLWCTSSGALNASLKGGVPLSEEQLCESGIITNSLLHSDSKNSQKEKDKKKAHPSFFPLSRQLHTFQQTGPPPC